jgi:CNT family concentrative nucleoside transporter
VLDATPAPQPAVDASDAASAEEATADAVAPAPPVPAVGTRLRLQSADGPQVAGPLINLAFWILPTIIFFSALLAVMYHVGVMQWIVRGIAWVMVRTLGTSGAETLCVASNIFVGQTEAPMMIRPFLKLMTRSELMAVMVGGFATIAGGVMAAYVGMLKGAFGTLAPEFAGHLMAASVMSAPAALVMAKILCPETETPTTLGMVAVTVERTNANALEAFGDGVTQGLQLALNVGAMLIAFLAAVALINGLLGLIPAPEGDPYTLQWLLGRLFQPIAWSLGVNWDEAEVLGTLLGEKLVLTELMAYTHLCELGPNALSPRTTVIASYALCGFANFASVGIQLGGIGGMAPERRRDLSTLALRAMLGGAFASWMTAAIAGVLI